MLIDYSLLMHWMIYGLYMILAYMLPINHLVLCLFEKIDEPPIFSLHCLLQNAISLTLWQTIHYVWSCNQLFLHVLNVWVKTKRFICKMIYQLCLAVNWQNLKRCGKCITSERGVCRDFWMRENNIVALKTLTSVMQNWDVALLKVSIAKFP